MREPYFGWCDVEGCDQEGESGGMCWRDTGYWTVCGKHADEYRAGKPQPPMKQAAIDREGTRDANGWLPMNKGLSFNKSRKPTHPEGWVGGMRLPRFKLFNKVNNYFLI